MAGDGPGSPSGRRSTSSTSLADVDATVLAYAQWLSELQSQASDVRCHQQAELDVLREAVSAQSSELSEFKRHCAQLIQQLQGQVSELRSKLGERAGVGAIGASEDSFGLGLASLSEGSPALGLKATASLEISKLHRSLGVVQEQTLLKFGEVDQAMNILHGNCTNLHKELQGSRGDWKKSQESC
ncbi:unnamed protein product [Effrenium voratum]|uniref:Uncharacterized protein n=1 Tax=Effrenium voratum TaxID=2562239 RepID=A0AA36IH98_9DINO|nr:unnamed protein product [Effrenium voratum]